MSRDQPVHVSPLCLQDVDLFSLGLLYFLYSCGVFLCFQPSSVNNHHLVALLLLLGQEGSTLAEHLAITSRVSSTTPTLCGDLMSPSFPFDRGTSLAFIYCRRH